MKKRIISLLKLHHKELEEAGVTKIWYDEDGSGWNQSVNISIEYKDQKPERVPIYKLQNDGTKKQDGDTDYLRLSPVAEAAVQKALDEMVPSLDAMNLSFYFKTSVYTINSTLVYPISEIEKGYKKTIKELESQIATLKFEIEELKK